MSIVFINATDDGVGQVLQHAGSFICGKLGLEKVVENPFGEFAVLLAYFRRTIPTVPNISDSDYTEAVGFLEME